jgi:hypothetical protein
MIQKKTALKYAKELRRFVEIMRKTCDEVKSCTKCKFCDVNEVGYCNQKYDKICNHLAYGTPLTLDAIISDLGGDDERD